MKSGDKQLTLTGGILGVVSVLAYILAITVPFPQPLPYVIAMLWPILSIVFSYSLYSFIASSHQSHSNRLAFIFAALGFTTLGIMISAQLSVGYGMQELISELEGHSEETVRLVRRTARLIDMGIDVAWDLLIGTSLILLGFAMKPHPSFGLKWGVPSGILGILLILLNLLTFPWPPDTRDLVDVGPFIGVFIIFLAIRLALMGRRMK